MRRGRKGPLYSDRGTTTTSQRCSVNGSGRIFVPSLVLVSFPRLSSIASPLSPLPLLRALVDKWGNMKQLVELLVLFPPPKVVLQNLFYKQMGNLLCPAACVILSSSVLETSVCLCTLVLDPVCLGNSFLHLTRLGLMPLSRHRC